MKKYLLLLLLPVFVFLSCNDDDGYSLNKFWISIGTVENTDNSSNFYIRLDNNVLLYVTANTYYNYRPRTGQRIIANYTILNDKPDNSLYDHDVRLNDAYNILTKNIFEVTPETQDSIGNDPVGIDELWISSDFLNVRFYYRGYNTVHYINLVKDVSDQHNDGRIHLEFRHNANNDSPNYKRKGFVSFNLTSLLTEPVVNGDAYEIVLYVNDYTDPNKTYNLKWNPESNSSDRNINTEDFDEGKEVNVE